MRSTIRPPATGDGGPRIRVASIAGHEERMGGPTWIADPAPSGWTPASGQGGRWFDCIEVFYNRQRLHSALESKRPAAYEPQHQAA